MRRSQCWTLSSVQLAIHYCRHQGSSSSGSGSGSGSSSTNKNNTNSGKASNNMDNKNNENVAARRLVNSLGFELENMEHLLQSFATGEKFTPVVSRKKNTFSPSRLVNACMTHPQLSPLFEKVSLACGAVFTSPPHERGKETTGITEWKNEKLHSLLHRCALRVEKDVQIKDMEHLSEMQLQLSAMTVLASALRKFMQELHREGKRRSHNCKAGDEDGVKKIQQWRYEAIKALVEAFASLENFFCNLLTKNFNRINNDDSNAVERRVICFSLASLVPAFLSVADELQFHISRPTVKMVVSKEELLLLEGQITNCISSLLQVINSSFEKTLEGRVEFTETDVHEKSLVSVISAIDGILETMNNLRFAASEPQSSAATAAASSAISIFPSLIIWLLQTVTSLSVVISPQLERDFISCIQQLWERIAPPLERRSSDCVMTHRTVHASLNIRYARCQSEEPDSGANLLIAPTPAKAIFLLEWLRRATEKFTLWQLDRGSAPASMAVPYAVLCRTVLGMEVEVYFLACRQSGRTWTIPLDLDGSDSHTNIRDGDRNGDNSDGDPLGWKSVLAAAAAVRVAAGGLVDAYVRALAAHGGPPAARFRDAVAGALLPLPRRHFLDAGGAALLPRALRALVALAHATAQTDPPDPRRICGVPLPNAIDIAFFLTLLQNRRHTSTVGVGPAEEAAASEIDDTAVRAYVRDVLQALDHNTAKQLWHLRATKVQKCFTGTDVNSETSDERRQRRQAQSVLSVVHAHVMHPSFLWMPLQQLQEVVFMLAQNRELIEETQARLKSTQVETSGPLITPLAGNGGSDDDRTDGDAAYSQILSKDDVPRHFERALGYLSLRLFVVSNVLRYYSHVLKRQERPARSPLEESKSESTRRERRLWAKSMSITLRDNYPGMAAEVEGLFPSKIKHRKRGNLRVLARMQTTIQMAVRHSLLFHVKKRRKLRRLKRVNQGKIAADCNIGESAMENSALCKNELPSIPQESEKTTVIIIHLQRTEANTPLGFSLYGDRALIRRITSTEKENYTRTRASDTPFASALQVAGVVDPSTVVGWRILQVDGHDVQNSKNVIALVRGKCEFTMVLSPT
ncbi:uncharacterized protein TM35_000171600 [Trypanosoma theileri]|uniref:PDZ domain-containing protein n=1 Tax=Trypanosoma theileri TaxID=67003 RepID=A0A1X0NUR8_9TRYP|nr:uncharacterized protein TM35_000171600 [Trypanosoma theileri]ORC88288.1 hypothetical protein TM35_000171600 [Trypanosoma theileri]